MKILFANRNNCFSRRGGDTVQMEKIKEFLEKIYPDTEIKYALSSEEIKENTDSEIVHIFNITNSKETKNFVKTAKETGKKVVLTPIYCNSVDSIFVTYMNFINIFGLNLPGILKKSAIIIFNYLIILMSPFIERCRNYSKNGLYLFPKNKKYGKYILENSDAIMPNSDKEKKDIEDYYNCKISEKSQIIPNATDLISFQNTETNLEFTLPDNFILEAGRIEIMKNQLNLVKALKNNPEIPIVFVGKNFGDKYYHTLKKYAEKRGNVFIFDEIPHEKMAELYKKAKVHVLPSFIETTGLVTLEALINDVQIVTSDEKYCPIQYYHFDEFGFQCNPYDIKSIKKAILEAYNNPKQTKPNEDYKNFFCYENVAKMIYEIYLKILEK